MQPRNGKGIININNMEPKDIIITGIQAWDIKIGSNCKNIAREFSKKNRVLYVNPPLDRHKQSVNFLRGLFGASKIDSSKNKEPLIQVNENLWVMNPGIVVESCNWMPHYLFDFFNKINSMRLAEAVNNWCKKSAFQAHVLFTDSDMFRSFHLKELLNPNVFVYYSRDNLMTVPYWRKHGSYMEPMIMKKADVVVTNSPYLAKVAQDSNPHSYYVGQGCDVTDFQEKKSIKVPEDVAGIKGVKIGYVGLLTSRRLSISTLCFLAKARPEWQIILVGPEESCFKKSVLHQLDNVHFLGSKKQTELGAYVQAFDVCINPQVINDLTKGNYPRKIDEYLASGKPVIATYTPTMEVFRDHCLLAENEEDFVTLIEKSLKLGSSDEGKSKRVHFAKSHSWENSIKLIWESIKKINKD